MARHLSLTLLLLLPQMLQLLAMFKWLQDLQFGDGAMVRGDNNSIVIGAESHIQDRAVVSGVASTDSGLPGSVAIGSNVVVGMCRVLL